MPGAMNFGRSMCRTFESVLVGMEGLLVRIGVSMQVVMTSSWALRRGRLPLLAHRGADVPPALLPRSLLQGPLGGADVGASLVSSAEAEARGSGSLLLPRPTQLRAGEQPHTMSPE